MPIEAKLKTIFARYTAKIMPRDTDELNIQMILSEEFSRPKKRNTAPTSHPKNKQNKKRKKGKTFTNLNQ